MKKKMMNVVIMMVLLMQVMALFTGCGSRDNAEPAVEVEEDSQLFNESQPGDELAGTKWYLEMGGFTVPYSFEDDGRMIAANKVLQYRIEGDRLWVENNGEVEVYEFRNEGDRLILDAGVMKLSLFAEEVMNQYQVAGDSEPQAATGEEAASAVELVAEPVALLNDCVTVSLVDWSREHNEITIRIDNALNQGINTFGLPNTVIAGKSIGLSAFDNMQSARVTVAANSYGEAKYIVDPSFFDNGGILEGELFVMDPTIGDRTYRLEIKSN